MRLTTLEDVHSLLMCVWASTAVWEIDQVRAAAGRGRMRVSLHPDVAFSVHYRE
jgi:hypothetical protein